MSDSFDVPAGYKDIRALFYLRNHQRRGGLVVSNQALGTRAGMSTKTDICGDGSCSKHSMPL